MDAVAHEVLERRRSDLVPALNESRQQVCGLVRFLNAKRQGANVRAQLEELWKTSTLPFNILEALRPPPLEREGNFAALCAWHTVKAAEAKRNFSHARQELELQLHTISRAERMNIFLELERMQAARYLANKAYHEVDVRHKLSKHLSLREGYIRSGLVDSAQVFLDAQFMNETVRDARQRLQGELELAHDSLGQFESRSVAAARILLQRKWRQQRRRRIFAATQDKRRAKLKRMRKSRAMFALRAGMRAEDRLAFDVRHAHAAARTIQRAVRAFLNAVHEAILYAAKLKFAESSSKSQELSGAERKRLAEQRRQEESIKAAMREKLASEKNLASWRCEKCARLGAPRRFKTWEEVQEHLDGHELLAKRREDVAASCKAARLERRTRNLGREISFIQNLRQLRSEKERLRFVMTLVPLHIEMGSIVLQDGANDCGRHKRCVQVAIDSETYPKLVSKRHASIFVSREDDVVKMPSENQITRLERVASEARVNTMSPRMEEACANAPGSQHGLRAFIEDLGSTNGTSVNGEIVVPGECVELRNEDVIVFGACPNNPELFGKSDVAFRVQVRDTLANNY
ncbi:Hypothetical Protein FCC1311_024932 [Hondaea fermentalgiana]|uniref:FHA domain-containing protein n=1 Tax=Hondaea fermentalgiana TaxID=2315210 RepID=A0A2R5G5F1_9STRA|nr:Hypothetical Protein FCC1311_024932 [Hondaea fermentalgiana]|eukprot:GBG26272.1 Hypothetical Protein FCC1311_024932 [Hondaea fermentalgiana]